jgi:hypothetical protein
LFMAQTGQTPTEFRHHHLQNGELERALEPSLPNLIARGRPSALWTDQNQFAIAVLG